ncbi:MAG: hypothetical protein RL095_3893 [Verrucomicrobiota bacterium]|jgi:putative nucleotidyltransferase with HDIG domain
MQTSIELPDEKWWLAPQPERPPMPCLEGLRKLQVLEALRRDVDAGKMEIVEIPTQVAQVINLLNTPDWNYAQVIRLVEQSPGMIGDFLALANSAAFSRGAKASDLRVAMPRLGKDAIKAILFINLGKMFTPKDPLLRKVAQDVIEHSMAVGRVASFLSTRVKVDPNAAFLAGVLHDIGKLALLKHVAAHHVLPEAAGLNADESLFAEIFAEIHEEAGKIVCERWGLEPDIQAAIVHHHFFKQLAQGGESKRHLHLAALVNLADIIVRILGKGTAHPPCDLFKTVPARVIGLVYDDTTKIFFAKIPALVRQA